MRSRNFAYLALLGTSVAACADSTAPAADTAGTTPNAAVSTGEVFSRISISNPSTTSIGLGVGYTRQMSATLLYSRGGSLPAIPYAKWYSSDPCIATVTSASPSWGKVKGIKAGSTKIISYAWGKADTVTVNVTGSANLNPDCYKQQTAVNPNDPSYGTPSTRYGVKAGEKLTRVVLFAPKTALKLGSKTTLVVEFWYSGGGKLRGNTYTNFMSMNGGVASAVRPGTVTGKGVGTARVVAFLGQFSDTVPVTVVR